eukprot:TRINITY_DN3997_c0_g1_i1.p1 TRINITY_DN3997_c0_g1~~TRINITY_DN3997_c0_g1_i1.p1  ORF type:complete len:524 (-),score=168.81 TRINITY_DN3997_c0_g1_i1:46-1617(-)
MGDKSEDSLLGNLFFYGSTLALLVGGYVAYKKYVEENNTNNNNTERKGNNLNNVSYVVQHNTQISNNNKTIENNNQKENKKEEEPIVLDLELNVDPNTKFKDFNNQSLEQILLECERLKKDWTDTSFPATQKSVGNLMRGQIEWKRSTKMMKNPKLIDGIIEPGDILQGNLGDCYLLSALSILAEYPKRMEKIFVIHELRRGIFCTRLYLDGIPTNVMVDDFIPCLRGTNEAAFSQNHEDELWVIMMEKIYAKCYGGYEKIEGGITGDALSDLTGAPYSIYKTKEKDPSPEQLWKIMLDARKRTYFIAASVPDDPEQDLMKLLGLVEGHAYAVLDVKQVGELKLVQIRNPWGNSTEWTGDYSDGSKLWTESLKQQVHYENKGDGKFWMSFEDFIKYYDDVTIIYYQDDWVHSFRQIELPAQKITKYKFQVKEKSSHRLSFNQVRGNELFHLRISVVDVNDNVLGTSGKLFSSSENISTSEVTLEPGLYHLVIDVYSKEVEKLPFPFTIASYGEKYLKFKQEVK